MKKLFFTSFASLLCAGIAHAGLDNAGNVVQDSVSVECQGENGALNFTLNTTTNTINFTDTQALGSAEIAVNTPIGMQTDYKDKAMMIHVEYNWYYTAQYDLTLNNYPAKENSPLKLTLNGDDDDGAFFNNVQFTCLVK